MPNVTRGDRMDGLLTYLAGPGRANEHTEPHLVNGDAATFAMHGDAVLDRAGALAVAADVNEPRVAFGVDVRGGHVWHCSLSVRAEEGQLSDEAWAAIAQDFVDEMGFTSASGKADCRWVAVRHGLSKAGNDHVHIAVNLVREDGTKASVHNDFSRAQRTCTLLERRHGLEVLASREAGVGERGYKPGERAAAARREGAEAASARPQDVAAARLERAVRAAAGAARDEGEFVRRLHQAGYLARPRFAAGRDDVVAGYSVALRPHGGEPIVWYGGGRLARDLTLTRLREGWPDTASGALEAAEEWQATWRNPMRYRPVHPGRETHEPTPELWHEHTEQIAALRERLREVDPSDRSTWAIVARETSAAFAAWSQRLEPAPGPLAEASRALARSAQIRAHEARPRPAGLPSASGAAMLLILASQGGQGTVAEAILFRQLMKTAQALHGAWQASADAREAARIRDALGAQLDAVRHRLPALQGAAAAGPTSDPCATEAARVAQAGQAPLRAPGSPVPDPLRPHRPHESAAPPERGGAER